MVQQRPALVPTAVPAPDQRGQDDVVVARRDPVDHPAFEPGDGVGDRGQPVVVADCRVIETIDPRGGSP
nr:hypothetical protein [Streptomyces sp. RLB1-9]